MRPPIRPAWCAVALAAAVTLGLSACGGGATGLAPGPVSGGDGAPLVYVAVGASETLGAGSGEGFDTLRDAWPQRFYNEALPRAATYYNEGVSGITTDAALRVELPDALAVSPTVVTVWLNVDDLARRVTPGAYEASLRGLVHALRQGGRATVLVANVPVLDHLPAYDRCRADLHRGTPDCILGAGVALPGPGALDSAVDDYNSAIARVCAAEGAVVVDLHAQGDTAVLHPEEVSDDGFHPSSRGHAVVAALFAAAYRAASGSPAVAATPSPSPSPSA